MFKKSNPISFNSPGKFTLKRKTLQNRTQYSINSQQTFSASSSPSRSTSVESSSSVHLLDNKDIIKSAIKSILSHSQKLFVLFSFYENESISVNDINEINKLINSKETIKESIDIPNELKELQKRFITKVSKEFQQRIVNQMNKVIFTINSNANLPTCCTLMIENKICFENYPQVLLSFSNEYFHLNQFNQINSSNVLISNILQQIIQSTSTILKEFSLLIQLLDKDFQ